MKKVKAKHRVRFEDDRGWRKGWRSTDNDNDTISSPQLSEEGEYVIRRTEEDLTDLWTQAQLNSSSTSSFPKASDDKQVSFLGRNNKAITSKLSVQSHEWFTFGTYSPFAGFDLEMWWRRSVFYTRLNVILLALLFSIVVINLVTGVVYIALHFKGVKTNLSPHICETPECHQASMWLSQARNTSVDPCDNFYEFVCGSYVESDREQKSHWFQELIKEPIFRNELGKEGYLAKILKSYKNDETQDQAILYYKACLNDRNRKKFGMEAFKDAVENVFGTKDFNLFEDSARASNLEEIGAEMFRTVGHAVYLNMAFYNYPYIQILMPMWWFGETYDRWPVDTAHGQVALEQFLTNIMKLLGVQENSHLIPQMFEGFKVFWEITKKLDYRFFRHKSIDDPSFAREVKQELNGLCPPMGLQLDMYKVLNSFTGENATKYSTYHNYNSQRYFKALQICFKEDPAAFQFNLLLSHPKTAFVSTWVVGLFYELGQFMELTFLHDWNINTHRGEAPWPVYFMDYLLSLELEYQCHTSMWRSLGYLSSIRFEQTNLADPQDFLGKKTEHIEKLFEETARTWSQLPETINGKTRFFANLLFKRKLSTDVITALDGGRIDHSRDKLNFTDDHLRNSIISYRYTIEKARQTWIGSTDTTPSMKWWGHGDPREIRNELLSLQSPMYIGARLETGNGTAQKDKWETFLGRKSSNYILFPLTLFNEMHNTETLALHHASTTMKAVRTFLMFLHEADYVVRYGKYEMDDLEQIIDWDLNKHPQASHPCKYMNRKLAENTTHLLYVLLPTDSANYSRLCVESLEFYSLVGAKISFQIFKQERERLHRLPPAWSLSKKDTEFKRRRHLPGQLKDYTEEQVFFLAFVRQMCRQSWKVPSLETEWKDKRYELEATILNVLSGMEEFSNAWKCKESSPMNLGNDRCLKWKL